MLEKIFDFTNPRVTQEFGERPHVYKQFGLDGHNGIDFTHPKKELTVGTPVYAVMAGSVVVGNEGSQGYGLHVRINNDQYQVIYAHLSKVFVKHGDNILEGQKVGDIGNTGFSSGPHLHFGVREFDEKGNIKNAANGYKGWIDPRIIDRRELEASASELFPFHHDYYALMDKEVPEAERVLKSFDGTNLEVQMKALCEIMGNRYFKKCVSFIKKALNDNNLK